MNLELSDTTPVQKTYASIPCLLHAEVKHYLEDLLNRGMDNEVSVKLCISCGVRAEKRWRITPVH